MSHTPGHLDRCDGHDADGKPCEGRYVIYHGEDSGAFRICYIACGVCKRKPLQYVISVPADRVIRRKRKSK